MGNPHPAVHQGSSFDHVCAPPGQVVAGVHNPWVTTDTSFKEFEQMRVAMEPLMYQFGVDIMYNGARGACKRGRLCTDAQAGRAVQPAALAERFVDEVCASMHAMYEQLGVQSRQWPVCCHSRAAVLQACQCMEQAGCDEALHGCSLTGY